MFFYCFCFDLKAKEERKKERRKERKTVIKYNVKKKEKCRLNIKKEKKEEGKEGTKEKPEADAIILDKTKSLIILISSLVQLYVHIKYWPGRLDWQTDG